MVVHGLLVGGVICLVDSLKGIEGALWPRHILLTSAKWSSSPYTFNCHKKKKTEIFFSPLQKHNQAITKHKKTQQKTHQKKMTLSTPCVAPQQEKASTSTEKPVNPVDMDTLEFMTSPECDREEFAEFYLANQYENPNFRALGATNEDIKVYGRNVYDISAMKPCLGMVCVEKDTGKVIGCNLAVSSNHLQHLDEERLGRVAAHAAMVKEFARQMLAEWPHREEKTLVHTLYVGVLESHRGSGVFGKMGDGTLNLQIEHDCQWTWSYSTNAVMLLKCLMGKSGMSSSLASVKTPGLHNRLFGYMLEAVLPTLVISPEWMMTLLKDIILYFGYMPRDQPLQIRKLSNFMYNGERPFNTNHLAAICIYKQTVKKPKVKAGEEKVA